MTGNVQLYLTDEGITRGGSNTGGPRTEWDGGARSREGALADLGCHEVLGPHILEEAI